MKAHLKLVPIIAVLSIAGCGDDKKSDTGASTDSGADSGKLAAITKNPANASKSVTVGSKNFTEEFILGNIYAQALEAAGYKVKTQLNLGSEQIAYKALKKGQIDAYPEYTSTALTSFFDKKIQAVSKDQAQNAQEATDAWTQAGFTALAPTPFSDAQGFGMTKKEAAKLGGIKTISEVKPKEKDVVFAGSPECKQRIDCLLGLKQVYKITPKKFVPLEIGQQYKAADRGQAQLIEVFTTDGTLATGKYVVLQDDKKLIPPYNAQLVFNKDVLAKLGPDAQKVVEDAQKGLTTEAMQELNSRVDVDKQDPKEVAAQYLKETGLVK